MSWEFGHGLGRVYCRRDVEVDPVTIIPLADPSRQSDGSVQRVSGMAVSHSGETIVPVLLLHNFNVDVVIHDEDSRWVPQRSCRSWFGDRTGGGVKSF